MNSPLTSNEVNVTKEKRTPKQGEIWKEVDPRFERYVRIESVGVGRRSVAIRTVTSIGGRWSEVPRSRISYADPERFNGKRGGYTYHATLVFP